jgi:hypothetical protein
MAPLLEVDAGGTAVEEGLSPPFFCSAEDPPERINRILALLVSCAATSLKRTHSSKSWVYIYIYIFKISG